MRLFAYLTFTLAACGSASPHQHQTTVQNEPASGGDAAGAAIGVICDIKDAIYVVDVHTVGKPKITERSATTRLTGDLTAIQRMGGDQVASKKEPVDPASADNDNCGGKYGGHAGCSESGGERIHSQLLPHDGELSFGPGRHDYLMDKDGNATLCRDSDQEPRIAVCSTADRYIVVASYEDNKTVARVYDETGTTDEDGNEKPAHEEPVKEVGDGHYRGKLVELTFTGPDTATLVVGGKSEPCLAITAPTHEE